MSDSTTKYAPLKMSDLDIAWLAGYLEGEGCFYLGKSISECSYPAIKVIATAEDIVHRAARLMGILNIYIHAGRTPNRKTTYSAGAYGQHAMDIMTLLLPNMGIRRSEKIQEVLKQSLTRPGKCVGENHPNTKLTNVEVVEIKRRYAEGGISQEKLARQYKVSRTTITTMIAGATWRTVTG